MQNSGQSTVSAEPSLPESVVATSVHDSKDKGRRWEPTDVPTGAVAETKFVCTNCPQPYRYPTSSPYWIWWRPMLPNFERTVLHSFIDDAGEQFDIVRIMPDFSPYIISSHSIRCTPCSSKARRYSRAKAQMQNLRFAIGGRNLKSVRFSRTLASWKDQVPDHDDIAKEVRVRTNRFRVFRQSDGFLKAMGRNHCGVWFREVVLRAWSTSSSGFRTRKPSKLIGMIQTLLFGQQTSTFTVSSLPRPATSSGICTMETSGRRGGIRYISKTCLTLLRQLPTSPRMRVPTERALHVLTMLSSNTCIKSPFHSVEQCHHLAPGNLILMQHVCWKKPSD